MKIEKLYIPTYKREGCQITFDNLPKEWQDKAVLVAHPSENHKGYPVLNCKEQGKGIQYVRKWIVEQAEGTRFGILDDDISFHYTSKNPKADPITTYQTELQFDAMMLLFDEWMNEGIIHCGADITGNPPIFKENFANNRRMTHNVFYDGTKLPINKIDWTSIKFAEDYYVFLQLLKIGYPNRVSLRYKVRDRGFNAKGGCSEMRTLLEHNKSMVFLKSKYPDFVKLRAKRVKTARMEGIRAYATIYSNNLFKHYEAQNEY